jgi:superoxide dismutase
MPYELAPLPYDYAALEPFIDAETMKLHHDKHHQAYINNVNTALANFPKLAAKSIDDLVRDLAESTQQLDVQQETKKTFWDTWTFFLTVVALLGLQWYLRKRWGLV